MPYHGHDHGTSAARTQGTCASARIHLAPSETSMTSHGRVVCSNSHRCLGHGDGRERPPTAQSIELRPFRDRSDGQTARGRARPTRPPLTRPLTRPYRPVQLRCSQLSTVSKCCAPANLTHCRGRDSGGTLTARVCEHRVRTQRRLRVQWLAWRRSM